MNFLKPLLFGTCAFFAISLHAQTENTSSEATEISNESQSRRDRMMAELSLTPEQAEQVRNLNEKVDQKIQAIRDNASLDDAQKQAFIKGNREDHKRVMQTILTVEQFNKYEELLNARTLNRPERPMKIQDIEKTN